MSFNARIKNKRDTASNWETNNPVLLAGELIIVDTNAGDVRFKIGDGTKTYTQLPFQDESLYNILSGKQDNLTFDTVPTEGSANPITSGGVVDYVADNVITIDGGATTTTLADIFGEPPYTIEFTDEVGELSNITVAAGSDYGTYRLRNVAILTEVPTVMNDGDIALVIKSGG